MTFKSAIAWWYWLILGAVFLTLLLATAPLLQTGNALVWIIMGVSWLLGLGLPIWLALSTDYTLNDETLVVRSGPFRWRVVIADIQTIEPTNNPLSSPALSLDRLAVMYGNRSTLLISSADKEGFIKAIDASKKQMSGSGAP